MIIIDLIVILRDLLGLSNLFGAQTLYIHKLLEVITIKLIKGYYNQ